MSGPVAATARRRRPVFHGQTTGDGRNAQHPSFDLLESDARFFDKLPASFLAPIKLLHHEKMNHREMADQLGVPVGTVKSRIFRGREMIRRFRAEDRAAGKTMQEPTL